MKIKYLSFILCVILLPAVVCVWGLPARVSAQASGRIVVGDFSSGVQENGLPAGWQPHFFREFDHESHVFELKLASSSRGKITLHHPVTMKIKDSRSQEIRTLQRTFRIARS